MLKLLTAGGLAFLVPSLFIDGNLDISFLGDPLGGVSIYSSSNSLSARPALACCFFGFTCPPEVDIDDMVSGVGSCTSLSMDATPARDRNELKAGICPCEELELDSESSCKRGRGKLMTPSCLA